MISTIPVPETNKVLLHGLRHHRYRGVVTLTAHSRRVAGQPRAEGVDLVIEPFGFAASAVAESLEELLRR